MSEGSFVATDIVKSPDHIDEIKGKYCLLVERGIMGGGKFENLSKAINLMAEKGWRCIGVTSGGTAVCLYALMEHA